MSKKEISPVQDYWKFTRELRQQLYAVKVFERMFFELEDLCEFSVKNDISVINDSGQRVSVVDDELGQRQCDVYMKLRKAVGDLDKMLENGMSCFTNKTESENGRQERVH